MLILSLPRSGSSWLGATLGSASNALYLREPVSQSWLIAGNKTTLVEAPAAGPPPLYRAAAEAAFAGLPSFPPHIVANPRQWRLAARRQRRLVIKEVNPLATQYYLSQFHARLVLLVRHPAAVALSFCERGWWSTNWISWTEMGARQGRTLRAAMEAVTGYDDARVVLYEDFCQNPLACFNELFVFAGLTWDTAVADRIQRESSDASGQGAYSTSRLSREMLRAWASKMAPDAVAQVRAGFAEYDLPWYRSTEDWGV